MLRNILKEKLPQKIERPLHSNPFCKSKNLVITTFNHHNHTNGLFFERPALSPYQDTSVQFALNSGAPIEDVSMEINEKTGLTTTSKQIRNYKI